MVKHKSRHNIYRYRWGLLVLGALLIFALSIVVSLNQVKATDWQENYPGIDDDRGWMVQTTEKGSPLPIVRTETYNHGFWSGYELDEETVILWDNIVILAVASVLSSVAVFALLRQLHSKP